MPFDTNAIHGWNHLYRDREVMPRSRFDAFSFERNRPQQFVSQRVGIRQGGHPNDPPNYLDHQGHIVPQNMLIPLCTQLAQDAFIAGVDSLGGLDAFLLAQRPGAHFNSVTAYARHLIASNPNTVCTEDYFVDPDENNPEDRFDGYFSLCVWNPVNICRAPSDNHRGGVPGMNVDVQVIDEVLAYPAHLGIQLPALMVPAFTNIRNDHSPAQILAFLTACNATLAMQIAQQIGFYQFDWMSANANYDPLMPAQPL